MQTANGSQPSPAAEFPAMGYGETRSLKGRHCLRPPSGLQLATEILMACVSTALTR